jgi:hypothetical protein
MARLLPLLLLFCAAVLGGCESGGRGCPPLDIEDHFKTTGFSSSIKRAAYPDSSRIRPELSPIANDTLKTGRPAILMEPEKVLYSQTSIPAPSFQLLPAARACSPEPPRSEETIEDIRIFSNRPFRGRLPGDTLSTFFDVVAHNRAEHDYRRFDLDAFLSMRPRAVDELILLLDAQPDRTMRVRFTVEYEQKGPGLGSYTHTTEPVVLVPDNDGS